MKYLRSIALLLIVTGIGLARPALAVVGDATGLFVVTKTGFVLNRQTNTFDTMVTIKNTSPFAVSVPVQLAVSGLPSGVTLKNAAGTNQGKPYVNVTVPGNNIIPNAIVTGILLKFANPARVALAPVLGVYGDIPQAAVGLPSDPGEAGKATVAGIDSNGNGVRDDVERSIAFNNLTSEKTRAGLLQKARGVQRALTSVQDSASASAVFDQNAMGTRCLSYIVGPYRMSEINRALLAQMLNTPDRIRANHTYLDLLPAVQSYNPPDGKAACIGFDPDAMGS